MCSIYTGDCDDNLTKLDSNGCQNTKVIKIPEKMDNLIKFDDIHYCKNTKVTKIPELLNLKPFYCKNTILTKIPESLNLKPFYCKNTILTKIPELLNLEPLYCEHCTAPPKEVFNGTLELLYCEHFTKIPKSMINPDTYYSNRCQNTKVTEIPKKMDNLTDLNCTKCIIL